MAQVSQVVLNGQVGLLSSKDMLAAGGALFNVTNPTIGTGIVHANKTAWSATANGFLAVQNNNPVGGKNIYFDRLEITETATAPTGTLVMRWEAYNETGIVALTGAVATATPVQINTGNGYSQSTGAVVQLFAAGAPAVPAAVGTRRLQGQAFIPTGVCVANDVYVLDFSSDSVSGGTAGLTAARATAPARLVTSFAPICVAPQTTTWLNQWWVTAGANVPSYEVNFTFIEL